MAVEEKLTRINDKEQYVIVNIIEYKKNLYYYIVLIDCAKNVIKDVCKIVKLERNLDNNYLKLVEDRIELEEIIPLFKHQYA